MLQEQHPGGDTHAKEDCVHRGRSERRAPSAASPSRPRPGPPLTAAAGLPRGRGRGCARPARGGNGPGRCVRGTRERPGVTGNGRELVGNDREWPGRAEAAARIPGAQPRPRRRQRPNGPGRPCPALPGAPPAAAPDSAPNLECPQPKRNSAENAFLLLLFVFRHCSLLPSLFFTEG